MLSNILLQYRTTMTTTSETPLLCLYVFCGFYVIFYNILRYITVYYSIYYNILEYIIIYYNILEHIRKLQMCCPILLLQYRTTMTTTSETPLLCLYVFLWVLRNILQYITVNYDILLYIGIDYKITNVFTISFYSTTLSV